MQLVLTLFLIIACAPMPWPDPIWGRATVVGPISVALLLGLVVLRLHLAARSVQAHLARRSEVFDAMMSLARARSRQLHFLMAAFAIALAGGGWGRAVYDWCSNADGQLAPAAELALLAPFFIALFLSWLVVYPAERDYAVLNRAAAPSRMSYIAYHFRQSLALVCFPVGLIIIQQSIMRMSPEVSSEEWFRGLLLALVIGFLIIAPWILRFVLALRPLPAGVLRDRLMATAWRMRLRFSDVLVWNTRGLVGNAMIAGLLPRPRYVLFTDRILSELSPEELEGVMGHEVGHVRHRHLLLYVTFFALSIAVLTGLAQRLDLWAGDDGWVRSGIDAIGDWQTLLHIGVMSAYVLFAFGFLSRRCEREADLFGCRAVSCGRPDCAGHESHAPDGSAICPTGVSTFISALERTAIMNGMDRAKPGWLSSWQHSTIARRVAFLERVRDDPRVARQYRMRLLTLKVTLLLALTALAAAFVWSGDLPWPPI